MLYKGDHKTRPRRGEMLTFGAMYVDMSPSRLWEKAQGAEGNVMPSLER